MDEIKTPQYPQFYIATKSSPVEDRTGVLKYGPMFAIFDRFGDIEPGGMGEQGIYFAGTRFLSELAFFIGNSRPLLLSSTTTDDNCVFNADLTNVDVTWNERVLIPRGTLHVRRSKVLWQNSCHEQLTIVNHGIDPIYIPFAMKFAVDFADVFEIRGTKRDRRGQFLGHQIHDGIVTLSYRGLDNVTRSTHVTCHPGPQHLTGGDMQMKIELEPQQRIRLEISVTCDQDPDPLGFKKAVALTSAAAHAASDSTGCRVHSNNVQFNNWFARSSADVGMMIAGNPERDYPYAGVPWFSTVFGRDGIITALECLWLNPTPAKGVLSHLAATQATDFSPERDAEPGKILHESRDGEMAALGEVPFGKYYGAIDTTPLFVMLAGAYYERTGDMELIESIWLKIEAALHWIDHYGDQDKDGFLEYSRKSSNGLVQQGWKDSNDSVFHADGSAAEPPIALCEVQGYVYAAKLAAARLARVLGDLSKSQALETQARALKKRFEETFWCPELGTYALALDGQKRQCKVRTSNPGHCLFTKIANAEHAHTFAKTIQSPDIFSGWGIRTVSASEARYNPISYHNGSIWPHDNAVVAAGLSRYGCNEVASKIISSFIDASTFLNLHRMPELFCGLERREGEGPILYPVACAPQAWSAGAIFMFLESCLNISIEAPAKRVRITRPCLPAAINQLSIEDLRIRNSRLSLSFERQAAGDLRVKILESPPDLEVVVHH